jgi:predicted phage gp36 major capsid-like protein
MDATGDDTSDVTPALVALTERQAAELAELRERVGRAEGDAVAARAELERVQAAHVIELGRAVADRDHERAERQAAETARLAAQAEADSARAELVGWTVGGPLARAWRAFLRGRS